MSEPPIPAHGQEEIAALLDELAELRALFGPLVETARLFPLGTPVRKASGPEWNSVVVGYYASSFTPEGLVLECTAPGAKGQVHVEPAKRMERDG